MTKEDLIREISKKTYIEQTTVEKVVEALMDSIKVNILQKDKISLRGFGTFLLKKRAAKTARDIGRNISMQLPAHYIPAFKPSKKFIKLLSKLK